MDRYLTFEQITSLAWNVDSSMCELLEQEPGSLLLKCGLSILLHELFFGRMHIYIYMAALLLLTASIWWYLILIKVSHKSYRNPFRLVAIVQNYWGLYQSKNET